MRVGRAAVLLLLGLPVLGCTGGPELTGPPRATRRLEVDGAQASAWVSRYRRDHGLPEVTRDPALEAVAQAQADAMASANELSHTVAGPLPARLAAAGRDEHAAAENVSAGYGTLEAALGGWQRSPEHNRNLLFAPIRHIGIAGAAAPGTRYGTFWALVMTD